MVEQIKPKGRIARVVWEFNGPKALARELGIHPNTVLRWQQAGRIPAKWQLPLLELAAKHEIPVTAPDLLGQ